MEGALQRETGSESSLSDPVKVRFNPTLLCYQVEGSTFHTSALMSQAKGVKGTPQ